MLELRGISKAYGGFQALHPTDLTIPAGQTTVLIGTSGCGKSTLLRLMSGLVTPDTGTVLFEGTPVTPQTVTALRRRMGYVIQDGGLFPHLTVRANVAIMARYLGWDSKRVELRLAELAGLVRLPVEMLDRYPVQLSGGQRQRVGIMRALMLDPAVLFLDEPMAALDPLMRFDLQEDLRTIFQAVRKTVVLVTHDMGEAAYFGDQIVLLHAGRIVQQGSLADLLERPADPFVTRFLSAQRGPERAEAIPDPRFQPAQDPVR